MNLVQNLLYRGYQVKCLCLKTLRLWHPRGNDRSFFFSQFIDRVPPATSKQRPRHVSILRLHINAKGRYRCRPLHHRRWR